jgi:hypothetical protein
VGEITGGSRQARGFDSNKKEWKEGICVSGLKEKYTKAIKKRIYNYVTSSLKKIDNGKFILGDMNYSYKCHYNAVQKIKENKAAKVYACIAVDKNDWKSIIIHFINQLEDGTYQDNTWGWLYNSYDYYLIKEVDKSEHDDIWNLLDGIRKNLTESNSNKLLRILLKVDKDII